MGWLAHVDAAVALDAADRERHQASVSELPLRRGDRLGQARHQVDPPSTRRSARRPGRCDGGRCPWTIGWGRLGPSGSASDERGAEDQREAAEGEECERGADGTHAKPDAQGGAALWRRGRCERGRADRGVDHAGNRRPGPGGPAADAWGGTVVRWRQSARSHLERHGALLGGLKAPSPILLEHAGDDRFERCRQITSQ